MKVTREQAARNRDRIVEVAARMFRERGFDGTGVAELMKAAGLTHGGFYGHFGSKDELAVEACERAFGRATQKWSAIAERDGDVAFDRLVADYLSTGHRDNPGQGCAYAALAADAARHANPALRRSFSGGVRALAAALMRMLPPDAGGDGEEEAQRRRRALADLSTMTGALVLARAVDDPVLSEEILAAAREALLSPEADGR